MILNYASLILFLVFMNFMGNSCNPYDLIAAMLSIAVTAFTFVKVHVKTGLWTLVHSKIDKLDEREIYLTHESLRSAYSIFTVILLLILLLIVVGTGTSYSP